MVEIKLKIYLLIFYNIIFQTFLHKYVYTIHLTYARTFDLICLNAWYIVCDYIFCKCKYEMHCNIEFIYVIHFFIAKTKKAKVLKNIV